jgi:hypothetical protein
MKIRALLTERMTAGGLLVAGALLVLTAGSAAAQSAPRADGRWDAWLGCWEPAGAPSGAKVPLMCVVPASGHSAVDILTVNDGKVTAREHIDANGERLADTRDGCVGWHSAQWSRDNQRVYLHADYTCDNSVHRASTSLIAMSENGDWMDVQGLKSGKNGGVRVLMYRQAHNPGPLPAEVAGAIGNRAMAVEAARVAAAAPIQAQDVADASHQLDAPVVEAWLVNRGGQMSVNASELEQLANDGVPGSVTDVMVALSYPQKFAVQPGGAAAQGQYAQAAKPTELAGVAGTNAGNTPTEPCPYSAYAWDYYGNCTYSPYAYAPWGYGAFSPYWGPYSAYSPYGYYNYSGYGSPYGYGYGAYGGGWFGYGQPIVVVQKSGATSNGGRLVKGRGYVQGPGSGTPAGRTGSNSGWGGGSESRGSAGSSSAGSSGGTSTGRTAHRTGGGGGR